MKKSQLSAATASGSSIVEKPKPPEKPINARREAKVAVDLIKPIHGDWEKQDRWRTARIGLLHELHTQGDLGIEKAEGDFYRAKLSEIQSVEEWLTWAINKGQGSTKTFKARSLGPIIRRCTRILQITNLATKEYGPALVSGVISQLHVDAAVNRQGDRLVHIPESYGKWKCRNEEVGRIPVQPLDLVQRGIRMCLRNALDACLTKEMVDQLTALGEQIEALRRKTESGNIESGAADRPAA